MPGGPRADHRRISVLPTGAWRVKPEAAVETQTCPGRRQRAPCPSPPAHTGKPSLNPELMIQAERFHRIQSILARRQPDLTVVMEQVNKEHNFSAVLRNCDAVGVIDVHAIPPRHGLKLSQVRSRPGLRSGSASTGIGTPDRAVAAVKAVRDADHGGAPGSRRHRFQGGRLHPAQRPSSWGPSAGGSRMTRSHRSI
jgi:hypothetical protein